MSENFSVRHNVAAMFAHRQAAFNGGTLTKALERLSSGYRVNRAADDAAGLAVSEKLRAQVRGYHQAAKNIQDSISLVQTAEAAAQTVTDLLQRIRELAVQASNGTLTDSDRSLIQTEVDQLMDEIDRIHTQATFNNRRIFEYSTADIVWIVDNSGSMAGQQAALAAAAPSFFDELSRRGISYRAATVGFSNAANTSIVGEFTTDATQFATDVVNVGVGGSGTENGMNGLLFALNNFDFRSTAKKIFIILTDEDSDDGGNNVAGAPGVDILTSTNNTMVENDVIVDVVTSAAIIGAGANPALPADIEYRDASLQNAADNNIGVPNATGGRTFTSLAGTFASSVASQIDSVVGESLVFHVGANEGQTMSSAVQSPISTRALGIAGNISVSTRGESETTLGLVDKAIDQVNRLRANFGAEVNRLEHMFTFSKIAEVNLQSAESRIRDTDMAEEISAFTRAQVMSQAANAMLSQANLRPQNILSLLG